MLHLPAMPSLHRTSFFASVLFAGFITQVILMAQPAAKIDVSKLGPLVGERVPDFSARSRAARKRNRLSLI